MMKVSSILDQLLLTANDPCIFIKLDAKCKYEERGISPSVESNCKISAQVMVNMIYKYIVMRVNTE